MAQDIQLDWTAGPTVTVPTSDVSDGAVTALTAAIDLGSPAPLELGFEWIQTTLTSCVDFVYLEAVWSHDNTDFSEETINADKVAEMHCLASADVKKVGSFEVKARYVKFQWRNESGGSLDFTTSNSALTLTDITGDQA